MDENEELKAIPLYSTLPLFGDESCPEDELVEGGITYEKRGEDKEYSVDLRTQVYGLNWPGKLSSKLRVQAPIDAYLRFCPERSLDGDNTRNVCVEGDPLLTLKFLKNDYREKITVVYLDLACKLSDNTCKDRNKRLACWSSSVYEKLEISRDLLCSNGLIFLLVGEDELADLLLISYEIFARDNLVGIFPRLTKRASKVTKGIVKNNDFLVIFSRSEGYTFDLSDKPLSTLSFIDSRYSNDKAKKDLVALFGKKKVFNNSKPVNLLIDLIRLVSGNDSLILDLAAKSGVVAQAVLELNAQDNGHRNFILVDIGDNVVERILATGKKLQKEDSFCDLWMDLGFKFFQIVDTFKEVDNLRKLC